MRLRPRPHENRSPEREIVFRFSSSQENAFCMLASSTKLEVLDLRHFSAPALRPLLEQEAADWDRRLLWDYSRSIELLLDFVNARSLTGYVAMRQGRVVGYAFGVCEAAKAVLGDLYAFGEATPGGNPVSALLLSHLLETLQAVPGVGRIESQLLLFPADALSRVFLQYGFRAYPRCFMLRDLSSLSTSPDPGIPEAWRLGSWRPEIYQAASVLIHEAYLGHTDAEINDQYRSVNGARRFLHNIVHFPGCGVFDPGSSLLLYDRRNDQLAAMVLCSLVRSDAAHITQLCVRPDLQGQGLGHALLRCVLQGLALRGLRTVSLTVTKSNQAALRLYEAEGFRTLERFDAWVWEGSTRA